MEKATLYEKYGTEIKAGRVLFNEGEPGDTMYIIQVGRVKITKRVGNSEKILMVLQKGDFFGEMAIVNQAPRTATATAVDNCQLLCFNQIWKPKVCDDFFDESFQGFSVTHLLS